MNIFFYCIIFIIGILFGSFFTLAVHRIPKGEDIIHTHSYCPNCNNKLGFFELIPVLSYVFLGGKCKHCGGKIRIRYLLLEILSGIVFVVLAWGLGLNIYDLNISNLIFFVFSALYIVCIFLIAGIDKENKKIEKSVLYYGIIISIAYIVYLYIVEKVNIYRYVMYLVAFLVLLISDHIALKKYAKNSYVIGILILITIMVTFTGELVTISTIIVGLIAIAIYMLIYKIIKLKNKNIKEEKLISQNISIAFFICCINMIIFLATVALINVHML